MLRNALTGIALWFVLLSLGSAAAAPKLDKYKRDKRYHQACFDEWLGKIDPARDLTRKCVDHWLLYVYGPGYGAEEMSLDPTGFYDATGHLRIRDVLLMMDNVKKVCKGEDPMYDVPRCERLLEGLGKYRDELKGFVQDFGEIRMSFRPALETALSGKPLSRKMLLGMMGPWEKQNLRKIRNAVFARHGRPFKAKDLNDFFYGPAWPERWGDFPNPPKLQHDDWKASHMTEVDKANVKLVQRVEKERG